MAHVVALYRYPVKGFTPEACDVLEVLAEDLIKGDRVLGIRFANASVTDHTWSKKHEFIALVNTPGIARLRLGFNHQDLRLVVSLDDRVLVDQVLDEDGCKRIAEAIENYVLQSRKVLRRVSLVKRDHASLLPRPIQQANSAQAISGAVCEPKKKC